MGSCGVETVDLPSLSFFGGAMIKSTCTVLLLLHGFSVQAEYAVLKAADNYCKAEIRIGEYGSGNPLELALVHAASAEKGQT